METLSQLPFRRLTKLYSDTKHSCDVVTEHDTHEDAPELTSLHRKFRIQKDRLIAWGLEWSDTAPIQGSIDESVARAGLTETVTSVLGTIKDVLNEAERIRCTDSSSTDTIRAGEKGKWADCDRPWSTADRSRYEDLAKDLTTSIDILYDLSRSRRAFRGGLLQSPLPGETPLVYTSPIAVKKAAFAAEDFNISNLTLINPSTSSTLVEGDPSPESIIPGKLDLSDLTLPEEEPPPYSAGSASFDSIGAPPSTPLIGHLSRPHTSTNPWKSDGSKTLVAPVVVEYAHFDSAYRDTGVPPPLDRLETLLRLLSRRDVAQEAPRNGLLNCLGYFEDPTQSRFGIVHELPRHVYAGPQDSHKKAEELRPVSLLTVLQTASRSIHTLNPASASSVPPLEDRFRLAYNLVSDFSRIHSEGFLHKDVNSGKVMLFRKQSRGVSRSRVVEYDLRTAYLSSFDLFSDYNVDTTRKPEGLNIYRHPEDPRLVGSSGDAYGFRHDIYGLALMLIEIGLWLPLADIFKAKYTLHDFRVRLEDIWVQRLASKCGTAYMHAVCDCLHFASPGTSEVADHTEPPRGLYRRLLSRLQRCCLLDEADPIDEDALATLVATTTKVPSPGDKISDLSSRLSDWHSMAKRNTGAFKGMPGGKKGPPPPPPRTRRMAASTPNLHSVASDSPLKRGRGVINSSLERLRAFASSSDINSSQLELSRTKSAASTESSDPQDPSKEKMVAAVHVIQRAWRRRKAKSLFYEYRRKIITIQKRWREKMNKSGSSTASPSTPESRTAHGRPGDGPEIQHYVVQGQPAIEQPAIEIRTQHTSARRKLRLQPLKLEKPLLDQWHQVMLPRIEKLIERALKDSPETVGIDLVAVGDTPTLARPTIFVTCSSTVRVKTVLSRKFSYDSTIFDLKVRKGRIRRSKVSRSRRTRPRPHRSMMDESEPDVPVLNPFHQMRPLCGASIGAYKGEHLPPVSYGGVVLVDDKPYGLTVHHLLDEPSDDDGDSDGDDDPDSTTRSSAVRGSEPLLADTGSHPDLQYMADGIPPFEISDEDDDLVDGSDIDSLGDISTDDESEDGDRSTASTCGDIRGVEAGDGEGIIVTQPAIDDVDEDFFPSEEDRDDDHIDSHALGHVHASSGIRRWSRKGTLHEIDWALLELKEDRLQPFNLVQGGKRFATDNGLDYCPNLLEPVCRQRYDAGEDEYPVKIANSDDLGNLRVHCFGRTTGLTGGVVGPAMSAVRIYRRRSFSRSWHVLGGFGFGGDSGAWVVENDRSRVCGHVLARCGRFGICYISPMDVMVEDIKRTLDAQQVCLPGAEDTPSPVEHERLSPEQFVLPRMGSLTISDIRRMSAGEAQAPRRLVTVGDSPTRMEMAGMAGQVAR